MSLTFEQNLSQFLHHVDALGTTLPPLMGTLVFFGKAHESLRNQALIKHGKPTERVSDTGRPLYAVPSHLAPQIANLDLTVSRVQVTLRSLPESLLNSLVGTFDAFLGHLIDAMFVAKPDILKSSGRQYGYEKLSTFASMDDLRRHVSAKEIETVLRNSHEVHFAWMKRKLRIELTPPAEVWRVFIELTERRNLFAHCDGIVSEQYLQVCAKHGVELEPGVAQGTRLSVPEAYFQSAWAALYEIATRVTHLVWRKLLPAEEKRADGQLADAALSLIKQERHGLAIRISEFGLGLSSSSRCPEAAMRMKFNLAQAHKWNGDELSCRAIIDRADLSSLPPTFKLAAAVLRDDFSEAAKIMKIAASDMRRDGADFHVWPIFRNFRESPDFLETYEQVYGQPFETTAPISDEMVRAALPPEIGGLQIDWEAFLQSFVPKVADQSDGENNA